jgi:hypothetical protein
MSALNDDIDALYALPLADFTRARNELAKRAGTEAGAVKALAKPTNPAWAVNQVFWRKRPVFDALVKASEAKRAAVVRQLGGKDANVAAVEARHDKALNDALHAAAGFLKDAGDAVTPATIDALRRTFEAVPSADVQGRLARPLEASGFSVLADLMAGQPSSSSTRTPGRVVMMNRRQPPAADAAQAAAGGARRSAADARATARAAAHDRKVRDRERAAAAKALDTARRSERDATVTFGQARKQLESAQRKIDALEEELQGVRKSIGDLMDAVERARILVNDRAADRVKAERRLAALE